MRKEATIVNRFISKNFSLNCQFPLIANFIRTALAILEHLLYDIDALLRLVHLFASHIIIIGSDNFGITHGLFYSCFHLLQIPFLVPVHAGIAAALFEQSVLLGILETWLHDSGLQVLINIVILLWMSNRHADVAKVVVNSLPCHSPFRG